MGRGRLALPLSEVLVRSRPFGQPSFVDAVRLRWLSIPCVSGDSRMVSAALAVLSNWDYAAHDSGGTGAERPHRLPWRVSPDFAPCRKPVGRSAWGTLLWAVRILCRARFSRWHLRRGSLSPMVAVGVPARARRQHRQIYGPGRHGRRRDDSGRLFPDRHVWVSGSRAVCAGGPVPRAAPLVADRLDRGRYAGAGDHRGGHSDCAHARAGRDHVPRNVELFTNHGRSPGTPGPADPGRAGLAGRDFG